MKLIPFSIIVFFAFAAQAIQNIEVNCSTKNPVNYKTLKLTGNENRLTGVLNWNYNGAFVACRQSGWFDLQKYGTPLKCVGVWNISFDKGGNLADKVVEIILEKDIKGVIAGQYEVNYDLRAGGVTPVTESILCKVK